MKISPIPTITAPTVDLNGNPAPSRVDSIRSMRMKTNMTPLSNAPELPPQDVNMQTEAPVEATQALSPQLALLAKQRRALQQERRELDAQRKALQSRPADSAIDVARLKSEPLRVLLENGVTYDQLTEAIMANQGNSELNSLKAEIDALKQGIDQKFTERTTAEEQQVLAQMRREAEQLVRGDEFELVRETRNVPQVMKLIERTYRETGEVLDVSEALRLVEDELFKDAEKLATLKKIQSRFNPPAPQSQQQRQIGMRTLTNRDTASVPMSAKARAVAAFYGTLKK